MTTNLRFARQSKGQSDVPVIKASRHLSGYIRGEGARCRFDLTLNEDGSLSGTVAVSEAHLPEVAERPWFQAEHNGVTYLGQADEHPVLEDDRFVLYTVTMHPQRSDGS
jgi:hypothetical protein